MSNWNVITDENGLLKLESSFGGFHDSCLREVHIWTGHSVDQQLAMQLGEDRDVSLKMFLQRQCRNLSLIHI